MSGEARAPGRGAVRRVAVGRVARAHGVKGEVSVLPLSDVPGRFDAGSRLFVAPDGDPPDGSAASERALVVASSRSHQRRLLVRFEDVVDRTAADAIRGCYLFVPVGESPGLPEGSYWAHELVGVTVVTEGGRPLGTLREVLRNPAHDVWVVIGPDGETLIPAVTDVIRSVDVPGGRVVVADAPGLTEPGDER